MKISPRFSTEITRRWENVAVRTRSSAEGEYECRERNNGTLLATRSVVFDGKYCQCPCNNRLIIVHSMYDAERVYLVMSGYGQVCYTDSVALRPLSFYNLPTITHSVVFSVLGARPVHLDVVTLWADHHPVDLKLSFSKDASNSTTLHVSPHFLSLETGNSDFKDYCDSLLSVRV